MYAFFFLGMVGKLYDDLTELYLVENKRIIETIKTVWTLLIFYYIIYYTDNKYDILWILFIWTFLPLVDWIAFTEDPYFFSLVVSITTVGISTLVARNYLTDLKFNYLIPCFILYCICAPITEIFCYEFNGPIHEIFKSLHILPDGKSFKISDIPDCDLEVSFTKLITRIISFLFLCVMIGIMYYMKVTTVDQELSEVLSSGILFALSNNGYFVLSIINQYYSIYFNPEIMKRHTKKEEVSISSTTV